MPVLQIVGSMPARRVAVQVFFAMFVAPVDVHGGPFDGAIIVSSDLAGDSDYLSIYSRSGVLLHNTMLNSLEIAGTRDASVRPRGVALDANDNIQLFYGTFDPLLHTHNPVADTSLATRVAGSGLVNNIHYGSIATYGNYVYLPEMKISDITGAGITRIDVHTRQAEFFQLGGQGTGSGASNLAVGLNGLLYARFWGDNGYRVFDPVSMTELNFIQTLIFTDSGFAVGADGTIYQGDTNAILVFAPDGTQTNQHTFATDRSDGFNDVDLHPDGTLVAGNGRGQILVTNTTFSTATVFNSQTPLQSSNFVAFFVHPVPEPSSLALTAAGLITSLATIAWRLFIAQSGSGV